MFKPLKSVVSSNSHFIKSVPNRKVYDVRALPVLKNGGVCMYGNIYAKQKCPECGDKLVNDENKRGCFCLNHPEQYATKGFIIRFGRSVTKYRSTYAEAYRLLIGLRFEVDENKFDPRDYWADSPLGFENLARKYTAIKEEDLKIGSYRNIRQYMKIGISVWGTRNIKTITYADIDDLLRSLKRKGLSDKTVANYRSCYNNFFSWVAKREKRQGKQNFIPPEIPEIKYKLGTRSIVSKDDQTKIIEQVKKNTFHINPKIWLAIQWLSMYIAIRPGEMLSMKERDVNVNGFLLIPGKYTKEGEPKNIPLVPKDVEIIKSLPRGLPDDPFFRWDTYYSGASAGSKFGRGLLGRHWRRACKDLGIKGVDMYGGTRHSSVSALRQHYTSDEIKEYGTRHSTSKAFERYMRGEVKPSLNIYKKADGRSIAEKRKKKKQKRGKVIVFERRRKA